MLARVFSGTTVGLEGVPIEVEVDIAYQIRRLRRLKRGSGRQLRIPGPISRLEELPLI
jgi:hypothetical protein